MAVAGPRWSVADVPGPCAGTGTGDNASTGRDVSLPGQCGRCAGDCPLFRCKSKDERQRALDAFVDYSNNDRPHLGINGLTPLSRLASLSTTLRETTPNATAVNARVIVGANMSASPTECVFGTIPEGNVMVVGQG